MTIIEYQIDGRNTPDFVTDGGYWQNPDDKKLIGVGLEGSIPDSIETFTLAELQTRERAIHTKYPLRKAPEFTEDLTSDEVNAEIKVWWDARS